MGISLANTIWQVIVAIFLFSIFYLSLKFVRICTPHLSNDPRLFPRHLLKQDKLINEHRAKIANEILANYTIKPVSNPSVEVRIIASNRGGTYLLQTFAFLLEQRSNYELSVCNVENTKFGGLDQIENFVNITTIGRNDTKLGLDMNSRISKENQDYWKCLELESQSRYILLIEDDSLIIPQFSNLLYSLISQLDNRKHIDYVKLYHPIKLRKIPSTIQMILVMCTASFLICLTFFRKFPFVVFFSLTTFLVYHCITGYNGQFSAEVRYMITRAAYLSISESCCTPAVIFRAERVAEMTRHFQKTTAFQGHAKDHILDESKFVGRQSDLNYVDHIGSFSSVRRKTVHLSDQVNIS